MTKLLELKKLRAEKKERERRERLNRPRRWASPLDMACDLDPTIVRTPALELINRALVDMEAGRGPSRMATFLAPQEGKSTLCSLWYPLWLLVHDPDLRIIIVSYSDEIARRWGADIKLALETWTGEDGTVDLELRLRQDSRSAGRWQVEGHRGGVFCAGVGGSINGRPGDRILLDDPLKNLEEAQSEKYRNRVMRTYQGVLVPRLAPTAKISWIQTLWHEAEPIQLILANEGVDWKVNRIPVYADSPDDPLGRAIGEPLVSARGDRDWAKIARNVGPFVFAALYQQRPTPAEGGLFKRLWWRYWGPAPDIGTGMRLDLAGRIWALSDCWRFATVDLAVSTKTSADWTVVSAWAITLDGDLVLLDRARAQVGEGGHFGLVRPLVERWGLDTVFVEESQYGTTLVKEATQSSVPVSPLKADTDKFTRALPASARVFAGRVWLNRGADWTDSWISEHASFPGGAHDDQVDTLSYAVRVAITKWIPAPPKQPPPPTGEIDFMNEPM